jgi:lipopolysaccharide biosynthesis glycosyltransferase
MIPVVVVADYRVEIGLLVALYSTLRHLAPGYGLDIHLLSGSVCGRALKKIRKSLDGLGKPYSLEVIKISDEKFRNFRRFANTSLFTYARFLIPELCPDLSKALYLDIDILVLEDISVLYDTQLESHLIGASIDQVVQRADHPWGILNYKELGIPGETPYFSAGILLMNLSAWREQKFAERCMDYAERHPEICIWWDQTIMNSLLAGNFKEFSAKWNQQLSVNPKSFAEHGIIHFAGPDKPWNYQPNLPLKTLELYFQEIDRTNLNDWRPLKKISFVERLRQKIKRLITGF